MCGIFGINEGNKALVDAASACILHRGPDSYGSWTGADFSFGFDRLAIIDLDERANQPMWDVAHEIGIIFNGEIYNYQELREELAGEFSFRTTSDTEVLIYGYKKYGPAFVERLRGMFAIAIYDVAKRRVFLFRDHAGIKPLLYFEKDGVFIFASEMKAIMRALGAKGIVPKIDTEAVRAYFGLGYIASPATAYTHVRKVPRCSYLEYDVASKAIVRIEQFVAPSANAASEDELATLLETSIMEHLIADVPVGVFFSGGTDSSLIASVLHKRGIALETFSIGVEGHLVDQKYFKEISASLGLAAHTYEFTRAEFDAVYEPVMMKVDEPCADMSIFPTYYISQKAAEHVKVVLSGEGGDELFFGYDRQRPLAQMRNSAGNASLSLTERIFLNTPSFPGKNYVFQRIFIALREPTSTYLLMMSPARDLTHVDAWAAAKKQLLGATVDPLYFDRDAYLENDLLRKTDFATSFNSIEGRVPLLDSRVISTATQFEAAYTRDEPSKPVLKRILARYLPKELVYRPKRGFGIPLPHSETIHRDLEEAIRSLTEKGLFFATLPRSRERLLSRYPSLCFALISLARSLKNNEALYQTQ